MRLDKNERCLLLVSTLARALSHRLRTPLSVISNDLAYLKRFMPPDEEFYSPEKCREISAILKNLSTIGDADLKSTPTSYQQIENQLLEHYKITAPSSAASINCDLQRVILALKMLADLINNDPNTQSKAQLSLLKSDTESYIKILSSFKLSSTPQPDSYNSFSLFFNTNTNSDSILPAMIDTIIWAHGWESKIRYSDGVLMADICICE